MTKFINHVQILSSMISRLIYILAANSTYSLKFLYNSVTYSTWFMCEIIKKEYMAL